MKPDTMKNLMPQEIVMLARFCSAALVILNARMLTLLGMLLCAAATGWCLWQPDWIRAVAASAFAVLVYWPAYRLEVQRTAPKPQGEPE